MHNISLVELGASVRLRDGRYGSVANSERTQVYVRQARRLWHTVTIQPKDIRLVLTDDGEWVAVDHSRKSLDRPAFARVVQEEGRKLSEFEEAVRV